VGKMKRTIRILVLATFLSVMFVCFAFADTINIPADYSTIQAGIDAAVNGDAVLVQPGTYVENINYNGKLITVASLFHTTQDTSYISQTIIDGDSLDSVVTFESGEDSTAVLTGFTITNGHAYYGGGINCIWSSSPNIRNVTITGNSANEGGGICCHYSSPILEDVKITENSAIENGGGVFCYESSPSLENVAIIGNNAGEEGGGICIWSSSSPSLENVTIIGNNAVVYGGGGMYCTESFPNLKNVVIKNNNTDGNGGGIHFNWQGYMGSTNLENVTIQNNIALEDGGGIYSSYYSLNLENVNISNNISNCSGGGIYFEHQSSSSIVLTYVKITGNTAYDDGGGIYFAYNYSTSTNLEHLTINGNSANFGGGIYCCSGSQPNLKNTEITDNFAYCNGGGICYQSYLSDLENVTISTNIADSCGGGIYASSSAIGSINNSIISNNIGNYGLYIGYYFPSSDITYSNFHNNEVGNCFNISPGTGCIEADPLFVDPMNGDYHLSWANYPTQDSTKSPCIDAGDPSSPLDPDGTIADMGAYYFNQGVSIDEPVQSSGYNLTNYPNPINSNINNLKVSFNILKPSKVKIQLFNIKGQLVSTLINEDKNIGEYSINHPINKLSSGIYFTRMSIDGVDKEVKKVILLR